MKPQQRPHSGDIQPHPPSGEPPPRRRRSGDVRRRSGDRHTRPDHKISEPETQGDNFRTRSGDARVSSHDQAKKQSKSPLTSSAPSIEQQVTSRNDSSEMSSHLTSQSDYESMCM